MCDDYERLKGVVTEMERNLSRVNAFPKREIQKLKLFYKKYDNNSSDSQTPIISGRSVIPNKTAPMGCYKLIEKHGDKITADSQIFEFDYYYYYPNKDVDDNVSTEINTCNEIIKTSRNKADEFFMGTGFKDNRWKEDYKPPGKIKMENLDWEHVPLPEIEYDDDFPLPEIGFDDHDTLHRERNFFKDYGAHICKGGKEYIPHVFEELDLPDNKRSDGQGGYLQDGWFITDNEDDNELLLGVPIRRKCYFLLHDSKGGFDYGYVEFHDHLVCVNKIISDNVIEESARGPRRQGPRVKIPREEKISRRNHLKRKELNVEEEQSVNKLV